MSEPAHHCFEIDVDGIPVRIHGDPNMSRESLDALTELARAAMKSMASMTSEEQAMRSAKRIRDIRRRAGLRMVKRKGSEG